MRFHEYLILLFIILAALFWKMNCAGQYQAQICADLCRADGWSQAEYTMKNPWNGECLCFGGKRKATQDKVIP